MTTTVLLAVLALAATDAGNANQVKHIVVFDFTCREKADYGKQLADSVRIRLRRHKEYKVIDRFTVAEMTPQAGISLKTDDEKIIASLKDKFAAHIAVFGDVQKLGQDVRAEIRCVDISGKTPVTWTKAFSDHTERVQGLVTKQIVEVIRGKGEWKPPEYGDEIEPKSFGKPLNVNGNFESGKTGWRMGPDNVTTFLVADPRKGWRDVFYARMR